MTHLGWLRTVYVEAGGDQLAGTDLGDEGAELVLLGHAVEARCGRQRLTGFLPSRRCRRTR